MVTKIIWKRNVFMEIWNEEIFIEISSDIAADKDTCFSIKKTFNILVQSARQCYVKLDKSLKRYDFKHMQVDHCLLIKHSSTDDHYVDDYLTIGTDEAIYQSHSHWKALGLANSLITWNKGL